MHVSTHDESASLACIILNTMIYAPELEVFGQCLAHDSSLVCSGELLLEVASSVAVAVEDVVAKHQSARLVDLQPYNSSIVTSQASFIRQLQYIFRGIV